MEGGRCLEATGSWQINGAAAHETTGLPALVDEGVLDHWLDG
jgi:hypothetical protein